MGLQQGYCSTEENRGRYLFELVAGDDGGLGHVLEQGGHHLHTPVSPLFQHQDYSLSRESQVCVSTLHYVNQWTFMWLTRKLGRIYIQTWWGVILYLGLCTEDGNRQMLLTYDDVTVLQKCNSIEFCNDIACYTIPSVWLPDGQTVAVCCSCWQLAS